MNNVLVVINDKKIPEFNILDTPGSGLKAFNADVLTYSDYYPFGSLIPNRHGSSQSYRYGFNGKEKDDEIKGTGVQYDYGFRIYDTRIGRFLSTDPLFESYPWYTIHLINSAGIPLFVPLTLMDWKCILQLMVNFWVRV